MPEDKPGEGQSTMSGGSARECPKAELVKISDGEEEEQVDWDLDAALGRKASIETVFAGIPFVGDDTGEPYEAASAKNAQSPLRLLDFLDFLSRLLGLSVPTSWTFCPKPSNRPAERFRTVRDRKSFFQKHRK